MRRVTVVVAFSMMFFLGFNASAQSKIKLAHINSTELMKVMPGVDTVQKAIQDFAKQLEDEQRAMYAEFQKKLEEFERDGPTLPPAIRAAREKELRDLQARIQQFEEHAQISLQEKQEELLTPIIERAKKAIAEVAKENGITDVFDAVMGGAILYSDESDDILHLVKKKLGIK